MIVLNVRVEKDRVFEFVWVEFYFFCFLGVSFSISYGFFEFL